MSYSFLFFLRSGNNRLKASDELPTFDIADKDDAITGYIGFGAGGVEPHYYHKERAEALAFDPLIQVQISTPKRSKLLPKMVLTTIVLCIRQIPYFLTSS